MDLKHIENDIELKNDLLAFTRKYLPLSQLELNGLKIQYTDKFIDFITNKSFKEASNMESFPAVMQQLVHERKEYLFISSGKATDIAVEGKFAEFPIVIDYDEKRGTLLKYNNRTINKFMETESIANSIDSMRNKVTKKKLETP